MLNAVFFQDGLHHNGQLVSHSFKFFQFFKKKNDLYLKRDVV